jgi:hypothetical protein
MLSQIDQYLPESESIQETAYRYTEHLENERINGEWEAMTAPYGVFADKSPEWWEGFLTALARRNGVNVAVLNQPAPCDDDWF